MPAGSSISAIRAPAADQFAEYPASWYLFGASADLEEHPVSKRMLGRHLVAFRTQSGTVVVMQGNCAHLGADLGCGRVVGETIQCPFHGWRYGTDGVCTHVPCASVLGTRATGIAPFARLQTYPVVERHGYVFFFNGREALFPLPFFWGEEPGNFVAGRIFTYVADCTWYMNASHAFDVQHFASVHDRELIAPPEVDVPAPFARRNSYSAKVIGRHLFDRLLHTFAGKTVRITISVCGGTIVLVTGDFGGAVSRFIVAAQPLENGQTVCEGICFAQPTRLPFLDRFNLALRRVFTHGYLEAEAREIRGTRYRPENLGANDREMIEYFQWVASLPQSAQTASQPRGERNHEDADRGVAPVRIHARAVPGAVAAAPD